jgi:leucyl aminopeptidase
MKVSFSGIADEISALLAPAGAKATPIRVLDCDEFKQNPEAFVTATQAAWLAGSGWTAKPGGHALLPGAGGVGAIIVTLDTSDASPGAALQLGALPALLPAGTYRLEGFPGSAQDALLAWLMGAYTFDRYLTTEPAKHRKLAVPSAKDHSSAEAIAQAIWFARELINLPANDLGPADLADALSDLGRAYGASVNVISGIALLQANFPLIHAVGRASDREPCLGDLVWGNPSHPKITLIGKGICFDTGGLDIKPPPSMALMKKDMAGAATAMALGAMIMSAKLPVRLRVLIPAADNSISGNAFRPGDIIKSRSGLTVEIANTDAEGRLILADALSLACEEAPDLLIDMATLTGAARVALGPDLPALYTADDQLASALADAGLNTADPVWRMPFWMPYDNYLKSKVADVNHIFNGPFAGSITAALFLKRFVVNARRYAHLDIFGWVPRTVPGKPAGGEPQTARALFEVIRNEFGNGAQ